MFKIQNYQDLDLITNDEGRLLYQNQIPWEYLPTATSVNGTQTANLTLKGIINIYPKAIQSFIDLSNETLYYISDTNKVITKQLSAKQVNTYIQLFLAGTEVDGFAQLLCTLFLVNHKDLIKGDYALKSDKRYITSSLYSSNDLLERNLVPSKVNPHFAIEFSDFSLVVPFLIDLGNVLPFVRAMGGSFCRMVKSKYKLNIKVIKQ